jgi:hypothetical protein
MHSIMCHDMSPSTKLNLAEPSHTMVAACLLRLYVRMRFLRLLPVLLPLLRAHNVARTLDWVVEQVGLVEEMAMAGACVWG